MDKTERVVSLASRGYKTGKILGKVYLVVGREGSTTRLQTYLGDWAVCLCTCVGRGAGLRHRSHGMKVSPFWKWASRHAVLSRHWLLTLGQEERSVCCGLHPQATGTSYIWTHHDRWAFQDGKVRQSTHIYLTNKPQWLQEHCALKYLSRHQISLDYIFTFTYF